MWFEEIDMLNIWLELPNSHNLVSMNPIIIRYGVLSLFMIEGLMLWELGGDDGGS